MKYARPLRLIPLSLIMLSTAIGVLAADITVDADCSLSDAIHAAESDTAVAGCAAGSGADTIQLTADTLLKFVPSEITSMLTIEGNGFSVDAERRHRHFSVGSQGVLSLKNVTLMNGWAERGGAIFNAGALYIEDSSFSNNKAYKDDGGAIYNRGQLTVTGSAFVENRAHRMGDVISTGGAIHNDGSKGAAGELTVRDTTFRGNWSRDEGGAIANEGGTAVIFGSRFQSNETDFEGGAIYSSGVLFVSGCMFEFNGSYSGGAIYNRRAAALVVADSKFYGNTADGTGGAIGTGGQAIVTGSSFDENSVDGFAGGAIYQWLGTLSVSGSRFYGNSAEYGGAIMSRRREGEPTLQLSIRNSAFVENSAALYGGAIFGNGMFSIATSSFSANRAIIAGGAILSSAGQLAISGTTFAANDGGQAGGGLFISREVYASMAQLTLVNNSADEGGGIYVSHAEDSETKSSLQNSLIAGNQGGDCAATLKTSSGNLIADGTCNPAISGDPRLGTFVEPEDGSPAYFPLLPDSPAIDAADPDYCSALDQIGTSRLRGAACDIGAIEFTRA